MSNSRAKVLSCKVYQFLLFVHERPANRPANTGVVLCSENNETHGVMTKHVATFLKYTTYWLCSILVGIDKVKMNSVINI